MSGFSGRLQAAQGSAGRSIGFGRSLPQGGFQSIDKSYSAEERCKVLPVGSINDDFGRGTEDYSTYPDNPIEDDSLEDTLQTTNLDSDTTTTIIDNDALVDEVSSTAKTNQKEVLPKLETSTLDLPDDFDKDD